MNRRMLRYLDWPLLALTGILVAGGVIVLSSARWGSPDAITFVRLRFIHLAMGFVAMIVLAVIDYHVIARAWRPILIGTVVMLALVDIVGRTTLGAQRWISLGPLGSFQPSELAKIALIITLAKHIDGIKDPRDWPTVFPILVHVAVPVVLILKQPDLGTALVVGAILAAMLFVGGAPLRMLGTLAVGVGAVSPVLWHFLHDYQRRRLLSFLDPGLDPLGTGYALIQSKIAIGSGQLLGKGLHHGTQTLLHFIPEQHTDFIFTVIGEELGFVGAMLMLGLFAVWLWRGTAIAMEAKDRLGMLMAVGVTAMVGFHVFINVGMTIGLMPITGIPLPFISHGGSALLLMFMATGLLLNVGMRRKKILF